jgi:hypothetical protein
MSNAMPALQLAFSPAEHHGRGRQILAHDSGANKSTLYLEPGRREADGGPTVPVTLSIGVEPSGFR